MALTKVGKEGITGISNSSDATAITINSSENIGIGTSTITNTSNYRNIHVEGTTGTIMRFMSNGTQVGQIQSDTNEFQLNAITSDPMVFKTNNTERLRITDSGSVGISTNSPDSPLHVIGDGKFKSSGEVKIRFQNDTTGTGSSDGSFVGVFNGSDGMAVYNYEATPIRFFTSNAESMRIHSGGEISVGTSSISGAAKLTLQFDRTPHTGITTENTNGTSSTSHMLFKNPNGGVGSIRTSGSATAFNTTSDHRLKENVTDMTGAISRVKQLAPKRFNFIADADTTLDGFLAHEAQTVVPEAVHGTHNEVDDDGNAVMQGIDQSKLIPLLTGALREAIAKIETLEAKVAALEGA